MPNLSRSRRVHVGGRAVDPDAASYLRAIGSTANARAINAFVVGLKNDGVWDALEWVWPFMGQTLRSAFVALKAPGGRANPALTNGLSTNAATQFVAADYDERLGITGDGTKYLRTPVDNFGNRGGNFHLSAYQTACPDMPVQKALIGGGGSTERHIYPVSGNPALSQFGNLGGTIFGAVVPDYIGLFLVNEIGAVSTGSFRGVNLVAGAVTPGANSVTSATALLGITILATATNFASTATIGFASAGQGLTDAQKLALSNRVETLMRAVGRRSDPAILGDVDGVAGMGQSLSIGVGGAVTSLARVAGWGNLYLDTGIGGITPRQTFRHMVEYPIVATGAAITPSGPALCNPLRAAGYPRQLFAHASGVGGSVTTSRLPGTAQYNDAINAQRAACGAVKAAGKVYKCRGIVMTDGEDDDKGVTPYDTNLATIRSAMDADIKALTGQSEDVLLFFSQHHSWTGYSPRSTPRVTQLAYNLWKSDPTKFILVGPKYQLTPYETTGGKVHLASGAAYRWLGEYIAKAWYQTIHLGQPFKPLAPLSIVGTGTNIRVVFNRGGLVMDTTRVTDPSGTYASRKYGTAAASSTDSTVTNYLGFEFMDDATTNPSASIIGHAFATTTIANDTVDFALSGTPSGSNPRIRNAFTMTSGNAPGPVTGPRGCLRDADTSFASALGNDLFNWCVTFDEAVA